MPESVPAFVQRMPGWQWEVLGVAEEISESVNMKAKEITDYRRQHAKDPLERIVLGKWLKNTQEKSKENKLPESVAECCMICNMFRGLFRGPFWQDLRRVLGAVCVGSVFVVFSGHSFFFSILCSVLLRC